jgi:hypothetical protein
MAPQASRRRPDCDSATGAGMSDAPDWMKREAASIPDKIEKVPEPVNVRPDLKQAIAMVEAAEAKMAWLNELRERGDLDEVYAEAMTESVLALIRSVHDKILKP